MVSFAEAVGNSESSATNGFLFERVPGTSGCHAPCLWSYRDYGLERERGIRDASGPGDYRTSAAGRPGRPEPIAGRWPRRSQIAGAKTADGRQKPDPGARACQRHDLHGLHHLSTHHALRTLPCPCRAPPKWYLSGGPLRSNALDYCVERVCSVAAHVLCWYLVMREELPHGLVGVDDDDPAP
jgi:hypothetical protein